MNVIIGLRCKECEKLKETLLIFLNESLCQQQSIFERHINENTFVIQRRYEVSEIIAKIVNLHIENKFLKQCRIAVKWIFTPEKIIMFVNIS